MSQFPFEKNELTPGISMESQLILGPGLQELQELTADQGDELANVLSLAGCAVSENSVFMASWVRERPRGHTEFRIRFSNYPLVQTWALLMA